MEEFHINTASGKIENTSPENSSDAEIVKKPEGFFTETVRFAIIALCIVFVVRLFVAQPFIVSGASMEETFLTGEYLIVDQISYRFEEPARGDVIIFKYPKDPSKFFIKRIIGLPGDTVRISGDTVSITNDAHPDGTILEEPYVASMRENGLSSVTLGDEEYFVMGDNRDASSDSRVWGTLPRENIIGRAYVRLFPLSRMDFLPGVHETNITS